MADEHEIRLKIDAGAAKSGARDFTAAINSIKAAVQGLDRDSSGAFTALRKNLSTPAGSTALSGAAADARALASAQSAVTTSTNSSADAARRLAIAVETANRVSTDSAARLALRLSGLGPEGAASLDTLTAAMDRFKAAAGGAESLLDVRAARSSFAVTASELNRYTTGLEQQAVAERRAAMAANDRASEIDRLRRAFVPLYSASADYAAELDRINRAEELGAVSATQAAAARERAALAMQVESQAAVTGSRAASAAALNVTYQLQDVATMVAAGQSPLLLAAQQGQQLVAAFQPAGKGASVLSVLRAGVSGLLSPMTLAVVAATALTAAVLEWGLKALPQTVTFDDAIKALGDDIANLSELANRSSLAAMRREYGSTEQSVRDLLSAETALATFHASADLSKASTSLTSQYDPDIPAVGARGNAQSAAYLRALSLSRALGVAGDAARQLDAALIDLDRAKAPADQSAAFDRLRAIMADVTNNFTNLTPAQEKFVQKVLDGNDAAKRLGALMSGASDTTSRASGAAGDLAAHVSDAADGAARLVQNLGNAPAALAAVGKSVKDQLAALQAENASLTLQADKGLSAVAANRLVQLQQLAAQGGAGASADAIAAQAAAVAQLDALAKSTAALQKKLSAQNNPAKGSKGLPTESQLDFKSQKTFLTDLHNQQLQLESAAKASELLAAGTYKTQTAAEAAAKAYALFGDNVSAATKTAINNLDDLTAAANNPVRQWLAGVPSWTEGARQIEADALGKLSDGLASLMHGEKVSLSGLLSDLESEVDQFIAKLAVKSLFGGSGSSSGGSSGLLDGLFSGLGGHVSNLLTTGTWREGGYSTAPVSHMAMPAAAFAQAPHYAEGTPNTSGGIPAILHPNEAVIPLSRGRTIPVEMRGGAGKTVVQNVNFTVNTPDADSFRRSRSQILADARRALATGAANE